MFRLLLEAAFVTIIIAWGLAKVLSALGRRSDEHAKSELAWETEMDPANHPDEPIFGTLGLVFAMVLLFLLLMPNAVNSNGQSISLHDVSHSVRASRDMGTLATFVGAWKAQDPFEFWGFFAGLLVTAISLFRRSPALLGVAVIASLFALWLKCAFELPCRKAFTAIAVVRKTSLAVTYRTRRIRQVAAGADLQMG
jgi:hypothetical protein